MARYDVIGNIAIVKFSRDEKLKDKKKEAARILSVHRGVRTILEKSGKFSGRLRTQKTKWIAGEKTKEALYRENGCVFRLNVDTCYFSPRLSTDRLELANAVKRGERVLIMFGGVAPYAVVIAKKNKSAQITSVELGREPSRYAKENVKRNKLQNVEIFQGNVRLRIGKGKKVDGLFNRIIMTRPNLKDSFLDVAFPLLKKGGMIHYHGFYLESDVADLRKLVEKEAKKAKRKVKSYRVKKACDIGVKKFRYRADFKVI